LLKIPARYRGLALLATAAMMWSSGGLFIKLLPLNGFQIAACRSLVAGLTIMLVLKLRRQSWTVGLDPLSLATSLAYASVLILFVLATKLTTAANAIFLQYAAPIYLLFLEPWSFKKPFPRRDLWAVAACMAGMSLFFAGHLERGGTLGNILGAISGLATAILALLLKWKRVKQPDQSPIGSVVLGNFLVVLICLPMALPIHMQLRHVVYLGYLGVFQLGISYMLFTAGLKYLSATAAMITCMLEAVFNPVWVFLGVGERPSPYAITGGLLIMAVIVWYNLRKAQEPDIDHGAAQDPPPMPA
jgi:drug/metabolite transporter (DMT)-like permease